MPNQTPPAWDALAHLAAQAHRLPKPDLVTGPQAAYFHHRWRSAMTKIIHIRILPILIGKLIRYSIAKITQEQPHAFNSSRHKQRC